MYMYVYIYIYRLPIILHRVSSYYSSARPLHQTCKSFVRATYGCGNISHSSFRPPKKQLHPSSYCLAFLRLLWSQSK